MSDSTIDETHPIGETAGHAQCTIAELPVRYPRTFEKNRGGFGRIPGAALHQLPEGLAHAAFLTPVSFTSWLAGRALMRRSCCSARSRAALRYAWSRPERYCGGQNWPMC